MSNIFAFIAISSGLVIFLLMIGSYQHLIIKDRRKNHALTTFWFFYPDEYDEYGKKMCQFSKIFFILGNASLLMYFILK